MVKIKILVTGGAGFIGSNFIRLVLNGDPECEIVNLDKLTYAANLNNLKDVEKNPRYKFVKSDICDKNVVEKLMEKVDTVVNFAAETHVDRSIMSANPFITTNVSGTTNLLEVARKNDIKKFIHISTDEVYGSINKAAFTEDDKLNPSNPYSASKAATDMVAISFFKTYGIPIIITRTTNNFGPYQHPEKLIPKMIINAILDKELSVYGEGKNIRDWLFVEDNCSGIRLLLEKGKNGEIYNIARGESNTSNVKIVKMILNKLGKSEKLIKFVKDRPGHDFRYAINCEKIKKLGWAPQNSFDTALTKTISWYTKNTTWWKPIIKTKINFHNDFE